VVEIEFPEDRPQSYDAPMATKRPVGRPPRIPDDEREAVVSSTATRLFAERGLHGTTMDAIATESGVRKPNLYRQFPSKEAAYVSVVERECDRLEAFLFRAYAASRGLPGEELAQRCVWAIFDFAERHPDAFRLIFAADRAASPEATERIGLALRRIADKIAEILKGEFARYGTAADTGAALLAEATVGMCVFAARRTKREDWDPETASRMIGAFLNAGLTNTRREILQGLDSVAAAAD
jgi:AcrR family transcriptional regulator